MKNVDNIPDSNHPLQADIQGKGGKAKGWAVSTSMKSVIPLIYSLECLDRDSCYQAHHLCFTLSD